MGCPGFGSTGSLTGFVVVIMGWPTAFCFVIDDAKASILLLFSELIAYSTTNSANSSVIMSA